MTALRDRKSHKLTKINPFSVLRRISDTDATHPSVVGCADADGDEHPGLARAGGDVSSAAPGRRPLATWPSASSDGHVLSDRDTPG